MAEATSSAVLEERLRKNPDSLVFSRVADLCRKNGDIDHAVEICEKGIERHPEYLTARIVLGRCYLERKELEKAAETLTLVCRKDRRNIAALKLLTEVFMRQGMPEKARGLHPRLSRLDPLAAPASRVTSAGRDTGEETDIIELLGPHTASTARTETEIALPVVDKDDFAATEGSSTPPPAAAEARPSEIEEVVAAAEAITGSDVSARMDELFPAALPAKGTEAPPLTIDAGESTETVAAAPADASAAPGDASAETVTGSDVSERMDELFEVKHSPVSIAPDTDEAAPAAAPDRAAATIVPGAFREDSAEEATIFEGTAPPEPPSAAAVALPAEPSAAETIEEPAAFEDTVTGIDISERMSKMFGDETGQIKSESVSREYRAEITLDAVKSDEATPADEPPDAGAITARIDALFAGEPSPPHPEPVVEPPVVEAHIETPEAPPLPADMDLEETMILDADFTKNLLEERPSADPAAAEPLVVDAAEPSEAPIDFFTDEMTAPALPFSEGEELVVDEEETLDDLLRGVDAAPAEPAAAPSASAEEESVSGDDVVERLDGIFGAVKEPAIPASAGAAPLEPKPLDALSVEEETIGDSAAIISGEDVEVRIDEFFQKNTPREAVEEAAETIAPLPLTDAPEILTEDIPEAVAATRADSEIEETFVEDARPAALVQSAAETGALDMTDETVGPQEAAASFDEAMNPEETRTPLSPDEEPEPVPAVAIGVIEPESQREKTAVFEEYTPDETVAAPAIVPEPPVRASLPADLLEGPRPSALPLPLMVLPIDKKDNPLDIPDHVLTPTLADIYFQQGQPHLAVTIYRRLLDRDPANEKLLRRVEEIEAAIARGAETETQTVPAPVPQPVKPVKKAPKGSRGRPADDSRPLAGVRIKKKAKMKWKKGK
jgi:pilus assembly protein FimV